MAKLVSQVYGDALFEAASDEKNLDTIYEEVSALVPIFKENQDLVQLLDNPQIVREEKNDILNSIFGDRISKTLMGFLTIIVEKDRQKDILAIFEYFISCVKEYKKIGMAAVTSAMELKPEQKKAIEDKLLATTPYVQFEMSYVVDPELIGGMTIRIKDHVVDSSIRTRLYELKKELSKLQLA